MFSQGSEARLGTQISCWCFAVNHVVEMNRLSLGNSFHRLGSSVKLKGYWRGSADRLVLLSDYFTWTNKPTAPPAQTNIPHAPLSTSQLIIDFCSFFCVPITYFWVEMLWKRWALGLSTLNPFHSLLKIPCTIKKGGGLL